MSSTEKKDGLYFKDIESLKMIEQTITETDKALEDRNRTIDDSPMSEVLSASVGIGFGAGVSFATLFYGGTVGLSAVGITTALAGAGAIIGGGMVAGIAVLAAPLAIFGVAGYAIAAENKKKKLIKVKKILYKKCLAKQEAIIKALQNEVNADKERIMYLTGLNIFLRTAIKDLKHDLEYSN